VWRTTRTRAKMIIIRFAAQSSKAQGGFRDLVEASRSGRRKAPHCCQASLLCGGHFVVRATAILSSMASRYVSVTRLLRHNGGESWARQPRPPALLRPPRLASLDIICLLSSPAQQTIQSPCSSLGCRPNGGNGYLKNWPAIPR